MDLKDFDIICIQLCELYPKYSSRTEIKYVMGDLNQIQRYFFYINMSDLDYYEVIANEDLIYYLYIDTIIDVVYIL